MALNFPDSPVAGTVFGAWRYDGTKWGAVSGVSGGGSAGDITAVLAGAGLSGGGTEGDVSLALAVPVTLSRGGTNAVTAGGALDSLSGASGGTLGVLTRAPAGAWSVTASNAALAAAAVTPTTWNPADKSAGISLSGGNLIATNTNNNVCGIRSVDAQSSGKFYFEVTCTVFTYGQNGVGICKQTYDLTQIGWAASGGLGNCVLNQSGTVVIDGGAFAVPFGSIANGTVICVAVDLTAKRAWFRLGAAGLWNGSGAANPATGTGGYSFPNLGGGVAAYAALSIGNTNDAATANFGAAAFIGAVPSGFGAGFGAGSAPAGPLYLSNAGTNNAPAWTQVDISGGVTGTLPIANGGTGATDASGARTNLGAAPLASPVFTGDPRAPTPATSDNDTSIATTSYVKAQGYLTPPVNLASQVTGTLPVANGGSGSSTAAAAPWVETAGDTMTGALVIAPASGNALTIQPGSGWAQASLISPSGQRNRIMGGRSPLGAGVRWDIALGDSTAETGSGNTGSNFALARYDDSGVYLNDAIAVNRATGNVTMPGEISFGTAGKITNAGSYTYIYSGSTAGVIIGSGGDNYGRNSVHSFQDISGTSTWARFNSAGTANVSGAWTTISDAALKESVVPYTRGLADLVMLRPVGFSYVAGTPFADPDGTPHIGLIAQEVEPYVPEIVGQDEVWVAEEKVTVQTLDPSNLIYAVLNALRELDERLRALETQP